eukprot:g33983.t1
MSYWNNRPTLQLYTREGDGLEECKTLCYVEDDKDEYGNSHGMDDEKGIDDSDDTLDSLASIGRRSPRRRMINGYGALTIGLDYLQRSDHHFVVNDIGLRDDIFNDTATELATTPTAAESPFTVKPATTETIWMIQSATTVGVRQW